MWFPSHLNPIIKLTENCNYSCYFCRYANHRQSDLGLPVNTAQKMIEQCVAYNRNHGIQNMNIIFHGGEPLLYGIDRFAEIVNYEKTFRSCGFEIFNSIQTNSSLINEEWINFFDANGFSVGISLDGPIGMNGHSGRSEKEAQEKALTAYRTLKARGIDCGFLSVITQKHLNDPQKFFKFLTDNDIESVGLCYCFNKADNESVDPIKLGTFLCELYDMYFTSSKRIVIREFEMATRNVLNRPRCECSMSCRESCGSFLTLTPDGSIEFCDDYDLERNGTLGNINDEDVENMLKTKKYQTMKRESLDITRNKCKVCNVFSVCKSGCMRNDCDGSNYFCDTFRILYPHIKKNVALYLNSNRMNMK